jgi:flavin reductase (DIM6/NTAB) family NADH-FMN oxidoreductase RutF
MDADAKKQVLRSMVYGLYAFGVRADDGGSHLMTVNWVTQVSFEPPMLAVAVENEARSLPFVRRAGRFGLSILPAGGRQLAGQLGRSSASVPDKLAGVSHHPSPEQGVPVLDAATGWVGCVVRGELPCGDHVVVVAEVVEAAIQDGGETLTLRETGFRYAG